MANLQQDMRSVEEGVASLGAAAAQSQLCGPDTQQLIQSVVEKLQQQAASVTAEVSDVQAATNKDLAR